MPETPTPADVRAALEAYMALAQAEYASIAGAEELDSEYMDVVVSQIARYADQNRLVPPPEIVLGISSALTEFIRGQIAEAENR